MRQQWCIPPRASGEFVWRMEDVLEVYIRPYNPRRPLVCMDELPEQLLGETRAALPAKPGAVARQDYEYVRAGIANVFLFCEPLRAQRWARVTAQRTKRDWAQQIQALVDEHYPEAEVIVLVLDNRNTPPRRALRYLRPRGGQTAGG